MRRPHQTPGQRQSEASGDSPSRTGIFALDRYVLVPGVIVVRSRIGVPNVTGSKIYWSSGLDFTMEMPVPSVWPRNVRSKILTSQLPISRWPQQIGDPTLADGILDRMVHNAHHIEMRGDSMRKNHPRLPPSRWARDAGLSGTCDLNLPKVSRFASSET
jgi:hypothetical protein